MFFRCDTLNELSELRDCSFVNLMFKLMYQFECKFLLMVEYMLYIENSQTTSAYLLDECTYLYLCFHVFVHTSCGFLFAMSLLLKITAPKKRPKRKGGTLSRQPFFNPLNCFYETEILISTQVTENICVLILFLCMKNLSNTLNYPTEDFK